MDEHTLEALLAKKEELSTTLTGDDRKRELRKIRKKIRDVGVLRHSNRYGNFTTVEQICGENLRKHGYSLG